MKANKYEFPLEIEGRTFKFKVDWKDEVWLIDAKNSQMADAREQTRPAKDEEDAKEIAVLMLYGMGLIKKSSCEMYLKNQSL